MPAPIKARSSSNGLRERKKLQMRDAMARAALDLATVHGIAAVRIEDIAAAVNVSPRTFSNYFQNKYEVLTQSYLNRMRFLAQELEAQPPEMPLWDAIINAMTLIINRSGYGFVSPDVNSLNELRLLVGNSDLQGEILKSGLADDNPFAKAVAERTGTDAKRDLYPRLVAAAVTAVTQLAGDQYLRASPPVALAPIMAEALQQLADGLADPSLKRKNEVNVSQEKKSPARRKKEGI